MPDGSRPDIAGYDTDFFLWTQEQAARLRSLAGTGTNLDVDWMNVAEEIESLGKSDRRGVRSRLETIVEHLLKLHFSTALEPRAGWKTTLRRTRSALGRILDDSPSLRRAVPELLADAEVAARHEAATALEEHGEAGPAELIRSGAGPDVARRALDDDFMPPPPTGQPPKPTSTPA